ncbi:Peroxisome membrane anchor protein Pex14p N-terminal [Penicillium expansum]|nr:Peroxisome membrane anchor protein Pex14p N-terminal [Penicillium expansum]
MYGNMNASVRGRFPLLFTTPPTPLLSHIPGECVKYLIMPDDTSNPSSIPSWQRANKMAEESPSPTSDDAPATTASTSRQALLDQASKFLEDESIRDAPTERKVSFLESKGLSSDDIEQVLGISRNAETSSSSTAAEDKTQEETPSTSPTQSEATPSPPTTSSPPSIAMPQSHLAPASAPTPAPAPPRRPPNNHIPRIPLRVIKAAATRLGASLYGASEYLVKPMLANLTSARHELAATAETNLHKLNEKLEKTVSVIPAELTARKNKPYSDEEDDDASSITSDPTELFHRDVATQTSPEPTPVTSATGPVNSADSAAFSPSTAVNNHVSRVESITSKLREIVNSEKDASTLDDSMRSRLTELHHYCDGLIYSGPTYSTGTTYGAWNSNTSGSNDSSSMRKAEDEAIAGFRADIRGVKGALLSARNFPASRGGRLGGLPVGGR